MELCTRLLRVVRMGEASCISSSFPAIRRWLFHRRVFVRRLASQEGYGRGDRLDLRLHDADSVGELLARHSVSLERLSEGR